MDKREFLEGLRMQLSDLTFEERGEALEYYEEYFADAGEENEEEVILSLGAPEQVAEQIKAGLHKEEKGMFTENGYREKIESDNPPEVYGRKTEKDTQERDDRGPLPWGRKNRTYRSWKKGQSTGGENSYAYGAGSNGNGYSTEGQKTAENHTGDYNTNGQSGYAYSRQQAEKKKEGMSGGMIALIVVLCIFASPVILGLGAGLLGAVLGIFGAILGVIAALFAVVIAMLAAGVGLFIAGFAILFVRPFGGMICIAVGCFMIALFLLCAVLFAAIFSKFFPWLIRKVEGFGKYLSRKWSERKGKGEVV